MVARSKALFWAVATVVVASFGLASSSSLSDLSTAATHHEHRKQQQPNDDANGSGTTTTPQRQLLPHPHIPATGCGTVYPTRAEIAVEQVRIEARQDRRRRRLAGDVHERHRRQQEQRRDRAVQIQTCDRLCTQCIEIAVHLHLTTFLYRDLVALIPHPTEVVTRLLNQADDPSSTTPAVSIEEFSSRFDIEIMMQANINVVNQAFESTPFFFRLVPERTTVTTNTLWTNALQDYQTEISALVGSGDLQQLDVFLGLNVGGSATENERSPLGFASPAALQRSGSGDGVFMRYDALTGGGQEGHDLGLALVHQIGHWLGLYDTFASFLDVTEADPCNPEEEYYNDFVEDTPMMSGPSDVTLEQNCTAYLDGRPLPDTCPDVEGKDPLFNFMNSVLDICLRERGEFTCNQVEKMYQTYVVFREPLSGCPDPDNELLIEMVYVIDSEYTTDFTNIILENEDDQVLFESFGDHLGWYMQIGGQELGVTAFDVDLCVPRSKTHFLTVDDVNGENGFIDGSLMVYLDGELSFSFQGDFGSFVTHVIPGLFEPTTAPTGPTASPVVSPTNYPTGIPTSRPTFTTAPTGSPTIFPTTQPTESFRPTESTMSPTLDSTTRPTPLGPTDANLPPPSDAPTIPSATTTANLRAATYFAGALLVWLLH